LTLDVTVPITIEIAITKNKTSAKIYPRADANTTLKKRII
jgi:hypothetical protein